MTAPSRDFLVRQSVLNAAHYEMRHFGPRGGKVSALLRIYTLDGTRLTGWLHRAILSHFRDLTSRYGVSP